MTLQEGIFWLAVVCLAVAAWYSFIVMPRQRNFKRHQKYVTALRIGDEVITYSGIIGIISELDEEVGVAKIKIAEGVEVKIITAAILQEYDPNEIEKNAKIGLGKPNTAGE